MYNDLPSRQAKTGVADRSIIACSTDETSTLRPPGLQEALDEAMATTASGRYALTATPSFSTCNCLKFA